MRFSLLLPLAELVVGREMTGSIIIINSTDIRLQRSECGFSTSLIPLSAASVIFP